MKRLIWTTAIALIVFACATVNKPPIGPIALGVTIEAQSLPYAATVTWTASPSVGVTAYNCYLDGALVTSVGATAVTCTISVPTLGQHTIGVTAFGAAAIPPETPIGACDPPLPTTCVFQLGQPIAPAHIKIK